MSNLLDPAKAFLAHVACFLLTVLLIGSTFFVSLSEDINVKLRGPFEPVARRYSPDKAEKFIEWEQRGPSPLEVSFAGSDSEYLYIVFIWKLLPAVTAAAAAGFLAVCCWIVYSVNSIYPPRRPERIGITNQ